MNQMTPPAMSDATEVRGGMRFLSSLLSRAGLTGLLGQVFNGKRDYYEVFGYDRELNPTKMWEMYHRGGIARRIIHAYPDALWARPPQVYLKDNLVWNEEFDKFVRRTKLWNVLKKADILAGLGRYSVVLVGTNSGNLRQPLRKGSKITFLQPYAEINASISRWETNPQSPRFGLPLYYTIYPNRNKNTVDQGYTSAAPVAQSFEVHFSRIWHIANGALESPVYGIPRYAAIWNYLYDLTKIVGSSAESYWMTAYQGLHVNIDPEMEMKEDDAEDLSEEVDEYQHGLRRVIRTRGVDVKTLGAKVADPRGAFDVVMTLISGSTGIPKRILVGSEAGQLASSQDRNNWAERIEEERAEHAEPNIIFPVLEWLNEYGVVEVDTEVVQLLWPEAFRQSPLERGQTAAQTARTATNLAKAMEPTVIKKGKQEIRDPLTGEVTQEAVEDETGEALLTRDEARRIIGLSTDQNALVERPD